MNKSELKHLLSKQFSYFWIGIISVMLLVLMPRPLAAQSSYGALVGMVTDPSGAVVPGVSVTLTDIARGDKRTAITDNNGNYRFVNLAPASYRLEFESSGFKRLTREPVVVAVESTVRINEALQVGNITETVEVSSETPLLQTESSSLSHVVEAKTVEEMPLNGRNIMNLISLVPGIVPQAGTGGSVPSNVSAGHTNPNAYNNYQIGGGFSGQSASYLDGAPTIGLGNNNVILIPVQDSVQEFRVATNNVSPEYGRFNGGIVSMASKSGTNQWHGSAYEYFRNTVLNANDFFANKAGSPRPAFNQNQYGATLGGPIRKDKTFFFFNWEGFRSKIGQAYTTMLPTDAQRAGDFSKNLGAPIAGVTNPCDNNNPVRAGQIFDPMTTRVVNGVTCRTPFANNIISSGRFDYTANVMANVLKYYPSPNASGSGYNFYNGPIGGAKQQQFNVRVDENISEKQRFFSRYSYWSIVDNVLNRLGNITANAYSSPSTHQAVLGDTYSFSSTLIMENRLSFSRAYYDDNPPNVGTDLAQFGPPWATLKSQVTFAELPTPVVSGLYNFGGMNVTSRHYRNTWALSSGLTKLSGRHTIKFGGEVRLMDYNYGQTNTPSGSFTFDGLFTSWNGAANTSGVPFASFMLGYPASGTLGTVMMAAQYSWYQGYYVGDTYQAASKLTLNYGVRWELPGAYAEKHDNTTVLLPNKKDPLSDSTGMSLKGQLALVNSTDWPNRTLQQVKYNLFAPRVGFAYRIGNSTVIRGGYGITYLPMDINTSPSASPVLSAATAYVATGTNGTIPLNSLSNPFPAGGVPGTVQQSILQPTGRNYNLASLEGLNISGTIVDEPFSYSQQWNFNIQHELKSGLLFEIGYAGSHGLHLPAGTINLNQLSSSYFSLGSALTTAVTNPMAGKLNPTSGYNGATIRAGQLLRPYPQFNNVQNLYSRLGTAQYNSLQTRVEKRFGSAGIINANYTWAKIIGDVDTRLNTLDYVSGVYQDFNNIHGERSLSSFDVPHRFVASYVLELPIGKGKKFAAGTTGVVGALVSGWSANGIVNFQSGYPIPLKAQNNNLNNFFGAGTIRPNYAPGCEKEIGGRAQDRISQWFNTACFTQPGAFSFGNEGPNDASLRMHGVNNVDFTMSKNTKVTERVSLQFKAEFFNLFNRVQFWIQNITLGTSSFGTVTQQFNKPRLVQFALRLVF